MAGVPSPSALVLYGFEVFTLPSLDDALTRLAPALGNWTYLLVGVLAYLEAAAFIGLVVPGELTVVLGGAVARSGDISIEKLFFVVVDRGRGRRLDRLLARAQARARLPPAARAALPHHAEGRRAGRGHLQRATTFGVMWNAVQWCRECAADRARAIAGRVAGRGRKPGTDEEELSIRDIAGTGRAPPITGAPRGR